jgi:hypothetical protein
MRRVHRPVLPLRLDCGYVSRATTLSHADNINPTPDRYQSRLWLHLAGIKKARPPETLGIGPQTVKNFRLVGPLELSYEKLPIADTDRLTLVVYHAAPGSPSAQGLILLASAAAGEREPVRSIRTESR